MLFMYVVCTFLPAVKCEWFDPMSFSIDRSIMSCLKDIRSFESSNDPKTSKDLCAFDLQAASTLVSLLYDTYDSSEEFSDGQTQPVEQKTDSIETVETKWFAKLGTLYRFVGKHNRFPMYERQK